MNRPQWNPESWKTLCLLAFTCWMLVESFYLSNVAALVPQFVILGVLLLLTIRLMAELGLKLKFTPESEEVELKLPESGLPPDNQGQDQNRFLVAVVWISLLAFSTWLLGVVIGPALFCLVFLRGSAGESWLMSLGYTAIVASITGLIFSVLLKVAPYQGVLAGALN